MSILQLDFVPLNYYARLGGLIVMTFKKAILVKLGANFATESLILKWSLKCQTWQCMISIK